MKPRLVDRVSAVSETRLLLALVHFHMAGSGRVFDRTTAILLLRVARNARVARLAQRGLNTLLALRQRNADQRSLLGIQIMD